MVAVLLRRVGFAALVMLGAGVVVSLLLSFVPDQSTDLTAWGRFVQNLGTLITFDYGVSEAANFSIATILWDRGVKSLTLIGGAIFLMVAVGVPLGVGSAIREDSRALQVATGAVQALSSIPILVWAFVLLIGSGLTFGVYPSFNNLAGAGLGETVLIYVVPIAALALGDGMLSDIVRNVQTETERELNQTYVRALRARSVSASRHLRRGILAPTLSSIANKITYLISGTIVVEYVFNVQGLAYQILTSITGVKDYPLVLAATMIFVGLIVVLDLLSDLAALATDPRLRTSSSF